MVDTDFLVTLDDGSSFGSSVGGDGYVGVIRFTTSSDGRTFTGTTGTAADFQFDNVYGTAGGNFCQEYRPGRTTQNSVMAEPALLGSIHGTVGPDGSMTLVPDGRVGVVDQTPTFRGFAGARWSVNPDGAWEAFTTETASNPSGSLRGRRITRNPDGTYSVTLVSPGVIGDDWGSFSGTAYVEVWEARIVDAGAPNPYLSDDDGDGFSEAAGDCDDTDPGVSPAAAEVPYNGRDEDCSALAVFLANARTGASDPDPTPDDDLDRDGFRADEDCDDADPSRNPAAVEIGARATDGIDNNCDGRVDESWRDLDAGSYVFVVDPDQAHIDAGEDAELETYFFMGSRWKAIPGSNGVGTWTHPVFGTPVPVAGLIYFHADAEGNLTLSGEPKAPDASGTMHYPGDYRIAKFTSPGGEYTSYLETAGETGTYWGASTASPGRLEFHLTHAMADTQYAGTEIPFPYDPLGTEAYTNDNGEVHAGIRVQYQGTSAYDINGDGAVDGNDRYWSVRLAAAGNVPDSVPGFAGAPYGHVLSGWIVYLGPSSNTAPTAEAGENVRTLVGTAVTLDGTASADPDPGDGVASYAWRLVRKPLGSRVVVTDPSAAVQTLVPDLPGAYALELTVTDASRGARSAADRVWIAAVPADAADADRDALADGDEPSLGLSAETSDSDGDGIPDGVDPFPDSPLSCFVTEAHDMARLVDAAGRTVELRSGITSGATRTGAAESVLANQSWISYARLVDPSVLGVDSAPSGALALVFHVEYNLETFRPGAAVAVTLELPEEMGTPALYKVRDGALVPLEDLGIRLSEEMTASRTVTYTLVDGGTGDEDGAADGILVDPVVIAEGPAAAAVSDGGGGGCSVAPGTGRFDDFAVLMIPLLVLIGVKWFREGFEVRRRGRDPDAGGAPTGPGPHAGA